jgi:hypothetical protein
MFPTSFAESPQERLVRSVKKENIVLDSLAAQFGKATGDLVKKIPLPYVNDEGDD